MLPDESLLRQYAESGDEAAFAELVRRHTNLVYSVARRVTHNGVLAEEVTQAVFTRLAQRAATLRHNAILVSWLYTNARHRAIDLVRTEARRHAREQEISAMPNESTAADAWEEIAPLLEEAMGRLGERDRTAIVLRYFNGQSHQQIGAALGLAENSAYRRVERALEKLRSHFARRGVTTTAAVLGVMLAENSVQAAPAGTVERLTPAALAAASGGAGGGWLTLFLMNLKLIMGLAAALTFAAVFAITWRPASKSVEVAPSAALPPAQPAAVAAAATPTVAPPPARAATAALPAATPAAPAVAAVVAAPTVAPTGDPQAEIDTAVDDIIRLLRASEILAFYETYTAPADKAKWSDAQRAGYAKSDALAKANPTAGGQTESMITGFQSIKGQTPQMNAAGDEATFVFTMQPPAGTNLQPRVSPMVLVKVNGKWYLGH